MRKIPESIRVTIATHRASGLMIAVSPDVPGMYVHGKSKEEIEARIPIAIEALCAADRQLASQGPKLPEGFLPEKTYELELVA
jgi:predicted RNase H-like HicB family nuclease